MEEYRIVPWDQDDSVPIGVDREFYIPPEIEAIAYEVLTQYEMKVSGMTLITSKPDKGGAIWRLETDQGPRSLKVLHREPRRSLFSVYAQKWLVEQGARVPALIPTREGNLYVEAGGKLWIVTDWISLVPASKIDVEGAEELVYGLGEFHRATRGYVAPELAQKASRIHGWPKYYAKMIVKIGWFRDLARAYPETAGASELLKVVEQFEQEAKDALLRFEQSSYHKMVAKGEQYWGLVHQDYGFSNGQLGPGGIWVIDLDGVSYDFPIRDLRKIITSMMDDMGVWDTNIARRLIAAYHRANPIDRETYEMLVIDMSFPNEFYKHIKEMIFNPELFMNTEMGPILARVLMSQESKKAAIEELMADAVNYEPGDYTEPTLEERRAERLRRLAESGRLQLQPRYVAIGTLEEQPAAAGGEMPHGAVAYAAAETPTDGPAAGDAAAVAAGQPSSDGQSALRHRAGGSLPDPAPVSDAPMVTAPHLGSPVFKEVRWTRQRIPSGTNGGAVRRRRSPGKRKAVGRRRRVRLAQRKRIATKRLVRRGAKVTSSAKRAAMRRAARTATRRRTKKRSRQAAARA